MTSLPAIRVKNLIKKFGDFTAVNNVSFDIPTGQIVGLLGGNGAGKTTTLSMLVGILLPSSGDISMLGIDMLKNRYDALKDMNFSSPYVDLPFRLSVRENLLVFSRLYNIKNFKERIEILAKELDLFSFIDKPYGTLSAGQRTRVLIAKSLINQPKVLLLDEPTASLDPDTADWMRSYLIKFQQETNATILLASHNMLEVERMCNDVIVMKQGRIADRGTAGNLITKYGRGTLEEVFLHIARTENHDA